MKYKALITIKQDDSTVLIANKIYNVDFNINNSILNKCYWIESEIGRIKIAEKDFDKFGMIKLNI
jgi:hypothetical protein